MTLQAEYGRYKFPKILRNSQNHIDLVNERKLQNIVTDTIPRPKTFRHSVNAPSLPELCGHLPRDKL